jgi:hypothetical protein
MTLRLTIAIPTYDRNDLLHRHVAELLPQLTSDVCLIILDNASPKPVRDTLGELLGQCPSAAVRIIRHRVNIGASANVMRCMELCETPWLWILGDDDRPMANSVTIALSAIQQHNDHLFISFNGMYRAVDREIHTDGLVDFVDNIPNFANMTLISSNLVHVEKMTPYLRLGYFYAYSLYPYPACLLSTLAAEGGKCCFSPLQLIEWGPQSDWSRILAGKGFGILLDVPMPAPQRRHIARLLNDVAGRYSTFAVHLLNQIGTSMDAATARHLFSQAWYRLYSHGSSPMKWVYRCIGYLLLRFPRFGRGCYQRYRHWRRYPETEQIHDEMGRT